MCTETIAAELRRDIYSRTASDVMSANPNKYSDPSEVPPFLYTCLLEMFSGSDANNGGDPAFLISHINPIYGLGETSPDSGIDIEYYEGDTSQFPLGSRRDDNGARLAYVSILYRIKTPVQMAQKDFIRNLDLRTQYILDGETRALYGGGGFVAYGRTPRTELDPTDVDPTLDSESGVLCTYLKDAPAAKNSAIQKTTIWRAEYCIAFAH